MKINSIIDLVKDLDTSRQTKNLNKLLIRILLHLQVEFSTNKGEATTEQLKYAAVHGVLFRGFSGKGFANQKALARPEIEKQKNDFFNAFWGNGDYLQFASVINAVADRVKISSKEYKIGAIVSVSKESLRKTLESAGIVRGLNSGF